MGNKDAYFKPCKGKIVEDEILPTLKNLFLKSDKNFGESKKQEIL